MVIQPDNTQSACNVPDADNWDKTPEIGQRVGIMTDSMNETNQTSRAYQDEDGKWVFPDGMCQTVTDANVGYGSDFGVPCGAKAMFVVTYDMFIPYDAETGEEDFWVEYTERVCDDDRGQMVSYAETYPAEMQITSVVHIPDTVLNPDNPDNPDRQVETTPDGYILHTTDNSDKAPEAFEDTYLYADWVSSGGWDKPLTQHETDRADNMPDSDN